MLHKKYTKKLTVCLSLGGRAAGPIGLKDFCSSVSQSHHITTMLPHVTN
jgi:hypothetical protein